MKITNSSEISCRNSAWSFQRLLLFFIFFAALQVPAFGAGTQGSLDRVIELNIPAHTALEDALIEWGTKAGLTVMINSRTVNRQLTRGIRGSLSARKALVELLEGSGLWYSDDGTRILIVPKSPLLPSGFWEEEGDVLPRLLTRSDGNPDSSVAGVPGSSASTDSSHEGDLDEVVVTAQKRQERLQDVPISISVLGGEQLDSSTTQGVTEALNSVPGVSTSTGYQGGGALLAVRGVTASSSTFSGSSPIAYYLDSVPFGLVDSAIAPDTSPYDLQRVEALRGPQGTLYGAGGEGGVVRVLTNDANLSAFELKGRATGSSTEYGGANSGADMAINVPLMQDTLAVRAVIDYQDLSGWIDKPKQSDVNDAQLRNARFKVNAQPTEQLSIGLSAWVSRQNYGAPSIGTDERQSDHLLGEPITVDYEVYGAKINYNFGAFSVTSMTSYLNHRESDTLDYGEYLGLPSYPLHERFDGDVSSEELNINSNGDGPWRWSGGAIYRDGENSTSQVLPVFATLDWTDTSRSYAAFGELSRRFLDDKFEWTLGARYFHDDVTSKEDHAVAPLNPAFGYYREQESFNSTTPRAVLTWKPDEGAMIYASYSEGFRSGAPQAYYSVNGVPGFPAVKPDKLDNYEIGAKVDLFDSLLSIDSAVYYMKWKDVQQVILVPFQATIVSALINGTSASGPGVDFGLTLRPLKGLELIGSISWNDLTLDSNVTSGGAILFYSGDRLNFSPKYTVAAAANYAFPLGAHGFQGRFSASVHSTSALSDRTVVAGHPSITEGNTMLIARTSFSIVAPLNWELSIYADNLTNDQGAVYRNPAFGTPAPNWDVRVRPRTAGVELDYHY